ncbi:uncharacterized protein LOC144110510 [Amblyomma americanum]
MAKYDIFRDMPFQILAFRRQIMERSGYHFFYQNGTEIIGKRSHETPLPKRTGYTVRMFIYCTDTTGVSELEVVRYNGSRYFGNTASVKHGRFLSEPVGHNHYNKTEVEPSVRRPVNPGDFFSIAVRVSGTAYLQTFFNEQPENTEEVGNATRDTEHYRIKHEVSKHKLLSLHVTIEEGADGATARWYGHNYWLPVPVPINTICTYIVIPTRSNPLEVYVEMSTTSKKVYFTNRVQFGVQYTFMIRTAQRGFFITNDFDTNKPKDLIVTPHTREIGAKFRHDLDLYRYEMVVPAHSVYLRANAQYP